MKKLFISLLLLGAPLVAQSVEVGVFVGQQSYKNVNVLGIDVKPDSNSVVGLRVGYSVVDVGPALFQLTAGYQPESKSEIKHSGEASGFDFKQSYWSVGAMFNFKAVFAVGAGIEYRSEKLTADTESTTYGRPWARMNVGYAIPAPALKPFIGLEVAIPLTSSSFNASIDSPDNLKSIAPKMQVGLYAGLRF
ncbi:MAG: porin [Holophagaceae bacterium]|nr:porin [Holophagaceae bacterium]